LRCRWAAFGDKRNGRILQGLPAAAATTITGSTLRACCGDCETSWAAGWWDLAADASRCGRVRTTALCLPVFTWFFRHYTKRPGLRGACAILVAFLAAVTYTAGHAPATARRWRLA